MTTINAKEAMAAALADIADEAIAAGFTATTVSGFSNAEYERLDNSATPECIFGELTVGVEGAVETIVFECATGVFETEGELSVSDDELAQKIGELRKNVRDFINESKLTEADDLKSAFISLIDKEEEKLKEQIPAEEPRNNTSFYITAVLGALAAVAFFLCMRFLF